MMEVERERGIEGEEKRVRILRGMKDISLLQYGLRNALNQSFNKYLMST